MTIPKNILISIIGIFSIIIAMGIIILNIQKCGSGNISNSNANSTSAVYNNVKYGYKLSYPTYLAISKNNVDDNNVIFEDTRHGNDQIMRISASSILSGRPATLDAWIVNYSQEGYEKEKDTTIDGGPAMLVGIKIGDEKVKSPKIIVFIHNDTLFEITLEVLRNSDAQVAEEIEKIINIVINGFRFEK